MRVLTPLPATSYQQTQDAIWTDRVFDLCLADCESLTAASGIAGSR
jgi:hypothetical protein